MDRDIRVAVKFAVFVMVAGFDMIAENRAGVAGFVVAAGFAGAAGNRVGVAGFLAPPSLCSTTLQ